MASRTTVDPYRPLLKGLYPLAALVTLSPILNGVFQVWPLRPTEVMWRFGAVGLITPSILGVVFGTVIVITIAALLGHRRVIRAMSVLSFGMVLVVTGALLMFAMDYLKLLSTVNPDFRAQFDAAAMRAVIILGVAIPVLASLAIGSWMSSRPSVRRSPAPSTKGVGAGIISPNQAEEKPA
jgi:hypothetical protein